MTKTRGRGNKPPKAVIAARLSRVYELARDGHRWSKVRRIVTAEAAKEAKDRKDPAVKEKPEVVWGDSGTVAEKTLIRYWKRAHAKLLIDGQRLVKQGDLLLAKNWSRQDDLYQRALEAGRFEVARKIIVDQLTLFGLWDVVKAKLSALDEQDPSTEADIEPDRPQPVQSARTIAEILDVQFVILNEARKRNGQPPLPNPRTLRIA